MKTVVVVSDLHINSYSGLCAPKIHLDDGGSYSSNSAQKWMWKCWEKLWEIVLQKTKGDLITIVNGDSVDINKHAKGDLITLNEATVLKMARETILPMTVSSSKIVFIRGTEAHTKPSAALEEQLAESVGAFEKDGSFSHYRMYLDVNGVKFDIAHHPESSSSRWSKGSGMIRTVSSVILEYVNNRLVERVSEIPSIILRAHTHEFKDSGENMIARAFTTPPWQQSNAFGYRIGKAPPGISSVGAMIFWCDDGEYTYEKIIFSPKKLKGIKL